MSKATTLITTLLLLFVTTAVASADPSIQIDVKDEAAVAGRYVRLRDVASVTGNDAKLVARIGSLFCGLTPAAGRARLIGFFYIKMRIRQSGFDLKSVAWAGTRGVWVRAGKAKAVVAKKTVALSKTVKPVAKTDRAETLFRAAKANVAAQLKAAGRTSVESIVTLKKLVSDLSGLPEGTMRVLAVKTLYGTTPLDGEVPVNLKVAVGKSPAVRVRVLLNVRHYASMVVSTVPLRAGRPIKAGQVKLERRRVRWTDRTEWVGSLDEVVGRKLTRRLRSGVAIQPGWLRRVPLVRSGEEVEIVASGKGWSLKIKGRARKSGYLDDVIEVENLRSRKRMQARITGKNRVEVAK